MDLECEKTDSRVAVVGLPPYVQLRIRISGFLQVPLRSHKLHFDSSTFALELCHLSSSSCRYSLLFRLQELQLYSEAFALRSLAFEIRFKSQ